MNSFFVKIVTVVLLLLLLVSFYTVANSATEPSTQPSIQLSIEKKRVTLNKLIKIAEDKNIDVEREKMSVALVTLFDQWISWDEKNVTTNEAYYLDHPVYKKNAKQLATTLPQFERQSVDEVLTQAIDELEQVISGAIIRKAVPIIDWNTVALVEDQLLDKGKPVFLGSYTWKTDDKLSNQHPNQYFGNLNSAYIAPSFITDEKLSINSSKLQQITNNKDQRIGQVFVSHKSIPKWAFDQDPTIKEGSRLFSSYDIDNPLAKTLFSSLFEHFVPALKGKRSTELGYMLFNEPSFFTKADAWNSGGVSDYTKEKFKHWLSDKHKNITHLNNLWRSTFSNFEAIELDIPMQGELRGTHLWYDWMRFNQHRVNQWFTFLNSEIKKHDSAAKTHIKLMPWLWNTDVRDHGLDFESLLEITDIIGFDANSQYSSFRGVQGYQADYSFDWQSAAMSFDFFTSIQPDQLLWDSENHFFNNVKFQERDIDPNYVRSIYWLAATHGLAGASTWLWGRNADGSIIKRKKHNSEFITEVTHQPIGFHALTRTLMDISAHGEDVQRLRKIAKPIRLFYSETSAINQLDYMKATRETYKSLYFEGIGLGFVTEKIINKQKNDWQIIVITNTPNVTVNELIALQSYVKNGGTILVDNTSLLFDEYNQRHPIESFPKGETVIAMASNETLASQVKSIIQFKNEKRQGNQPSVLLNELNARNKKFATKQHKTLAWRVAQKNENTIVLSIVNTGHNKKAFSLQSTAPDQSMHITNLFTGVQMNPVITINKRQTLLLEIHFGDLNETN